MTALKILKAMQANRNSILWMNFDRREAAFFGADDPICTPVDFNEAKMARTDPSVRVIDTTDGETLAIL